MLESKQHVHLGYSPDFYISNPINDLVKKGLGDLVCWLLPEDTTDKAGPGRNRSIDLNTAHTGSVGKTMFWIVVSIGISLAMGQLK